jgi:hypothetical protein
VVANVAFAGGPEKRVRNRVEYDVGIAVALQAPVVRELETAEPQALTGFKSVHIKANTYSGHEMRRQPPLGAD